MSRGRPKKNPLVIKEPAKLRGQPASKKSRIATSSLDTLIKINAAGKQQHQKAPNTREKYGRYWDHAQEFLKSLVDEEVKADAEKRTAPTEEPSGEGEDEINENEKMLRDPEFATAFEGPPSKYTPQAMALYLTFHCFEIGNGTSTADGIHAAFIYQYDHLDGDLYRGDWRYDSSRGGWFGNPTRSAEVKDLMESIKHKNGEEGAERKHSKAMSKEYMDMIYAWSMRVCPVTSVDELPEGLEELNTITHHLAFRAFAMTGWTVWSRNSETIHLQYKHLQFNGPRRQGGSPGDPRFFVISLERRKNWQRRLDSKDELRGHRYKIYPQPDLPSVDIHEHLHNWLKFYELLLRRPLGPEDFIFPSTSVNGKVDPTRHMSSDMAQKMITKFAEAAGIPNAGNFTTHCFRRGGAQYRFMFAPIGKRWTLAKIRWWGGWADGEKRDTLIRYLLDELHTYEHDYSDALCPIQRNADESHAGEAMLAAPLNTDEARRLFEAHTLATCEAIQRACATMAVAITSSQLAPSFIPSNAHPPLPSFAHTPTTYLPQPPLVPNIHTLQDRRGNFIFTPASGFATQTGHQPVHNTKPPRKAPKDPSRFIPPVSRGPNGWREIVHDWQYADPSRGLHVALREWDPSWYSGSREASLDNGALYCQRRIIANEFLETYHADETEFMDKYPECEKNITSLLKAIQKSSIERGTTKARTRKRKTPDSD